MMDKNSNGIEKKTKEVHNVLLDVVKDYEYHVQFPLKDSLTSGDNYEDVIWPISSSDDEKNGNKTLVVVLLGWAGAQDKYLSKYSDIYLSRGCIVVRYISPIKALFFDVERLPYLSSKILTLLKDVKLESNPIFFHCFSNGGGFAYSYLLRELALHHQDLDIRGSIFDSAPAPRDIGTCYNALLNIFSSYNSLRWVLATAMILLIVLKIFWYHLKTAFEFCIWGDILSIERNGVIRREEAPSQNWLSRISQLQNHHFLFIYSDADDLIPSSQVESFGRILEGRKNRVTFLKFIDSPHVQHYRMYPKEYVGAITKFIRNVMQEEKNSTCFGSD